MTDRVAAISGREPVLIAEIDQDLCELTYGVAPCTAALSAVFPHKCFNTFRTCQDPENYSLGPPLTLRFCTPQAVVPPEWGAIPILEGVSTTPTKINPGTASKSRSPLGSRAMVDIRFFDPQYSDFKTDPYRAERLSGAAQFSGVGYDPLTRAAFWEKWIARNRHWINRPVRVREGYIGQAIEDMTTRHYIMQAVEGPTVGGKFTIKAADILARADDASAQAPVATGGELRDAIDDNQTAGIILVNWQVNEYPTAGTVRIGEECLTYTGVSIAGDDLTLTGVTRGTDGTTASAHDDGDRAQVCYRVTSEYCWDVAYELLTEYAGVDPAQIDDWDVEGDAWLFPFTLTTLITEPTGVGQLLGEICEQCLFDLWWDERAQLIKIRALHSPGPGVCSLNPARHILKGSWSTRKDLSQRASQVWVFYRQKDPTKRLDEPTNFAQARIRIDPALESENAYGEPRIKQIYSRWLENAPQAITLSSRYLARFADGVRYVTLRVDAKDRDTWTGDIISACVPGLADSTGAPITRRFQVISAEEVQPGEVVEYDLQGFEFVSERPAFYTADDEDIYDDIDPDEPPLGAWYSDEEGQMPDGTFGWTFQ